MVILIIHVTIIMSITIFYLSTFSLYPFQLSQFTKYLLFNTNDTLIPLLPASELDINTDHDTLVIPDRKSTLFSFWSDPTNQ